MGYCMLKQKDIKSGVCLITCKKTGWCDIGQIIFVVKILDNDEPDRTCVMGFYKNKWSTFLNITHDIWDIVC
jgi:hypothetical protein